MDKYDRAIAFLTENPNLIHKTWNNAGYSVDDIASRERMTYAQAEATCLFVMASMNGQHRRNCGCLTQIRAWTDYGSEWPDLTKEIKADIRIPTRGEHIEVGHLKVFADYQRRIDREYGRPLDILGFNP